jgi:hypothetical protein
MFSLRSPSGVNTPNCLEELRGEQRIFTPKGQLNPLGTKFTPGSDIKKRVLSSTQVSLHFTAMHLYPLRVVCDGVNTLENLEDWFVKTLPLNKNKQFRIASYFDRKNTTSRR